MELLGQNINIEKILNFIILPNKDCTLLPTGCEMFTFLQLLTVDVNILKFAQFAKQKDLLF